MGMERVLEAASCLLFPGTPVTLATVGMGRKAGSVNYSSSENTSNKADPGLKASICVSSSI